MDSHDRLIESEQSVIVSLWDNSERAVPVPESLHSASQEVCIDDWHDLFFEFSLRKILGIKRTKGPLLLLFEHELFSRTIMV